MTTRGETRTGTVYLIGAGPGDPGLLTVRGRDLLRSGDVIVYDALANPALLSLAKREAERICAGKRGGGHTLSQDRITTLLLQKAREGKNVARLKGGDPYLFGRGAEEAEALAAAGIPFEVVPGISSAAAASAYAGIPLTHRAYASSVCLATGHEDPDKTTGGHNWKALARNAGTLVFFMGMKTLPELTRRLMEEGMPPSRPAALIRWGTTPEQRTLVTPLCDLPEAAAKHGFSAPCLIVIGEVVRLRDTLNWFERKPLFGKGIVVTRAGEQAGAAAAAFAERGAAVVEFPTIRIVPLDDYAPLRRALDRLETYDWLLFTSANGAAFFREQLHSLGRDARSLAGIRVAAMGPATAAAVRELGVLPDFVPDVHVAESFLAGLLARGMRGRRVLIPRALEARSLLPQGLERAGAVVDVVPVYATRPAAEEGKELQSLIRQSRVQVVTFASSSAAANFLRCIPAETLRGFPDLRFACIGPVTARTLADAGLPCHILAREFTIPGLVDAVTRAYTRT